MSFGDATVKGEGMAVAYDDGADHIAHPAPPYGWWKRLVRRLSRGAWAAELRHRDVLYLERQNAANVATLRKLQLSLLEELFRHKQDKITRLQDAYNAKRSPKYEDMRRENLIKDAESLAQSISALAQRAETHRARHSRPMRISDGTVLGVPGDQPNEDAGEAWH